MVRTACLLLLAVVACDAACITPSQSGTPGCAGLSGWTPSFVEYSGLVGGWVYCCGASSSPAGYFCQTSGECNNAGGPSPPPPPAPGPSYYFRNAYWVCGGKKGSQVVMSDGPGGGTGNSPDWSASASFASDQVGAPTPCSTAPCVPAPVPSPAWPSRAPAAGCTRRKTGVAADHLALWRITSISVAMAGQVILRDTTIRTPSLGTSTTRMRLNACRATPRTSRPLHTIHRPT